VPFARQELTSDANQQFVDRSIVVDAFKPGRDIGAALSGKIAKGLVYYNLGVFGGLGQSVARSTNDNLFGARVVVNPLGDVAYSESDLEGNKKPLVSVGANYFRNTLKRQTASGTTSFEGAASNYAGSKGWLGSTAGRNFITAADNQKVDVDSYGADAAFKWLGFSAQGEYLLGQAENQTTGKLLRAQGFYAQTGYMIIPGKLEAAFRYSYLDPNRDVANDLQMETIGALSYYFDKHNLKVQADVGNIHTQTSTRPTDEKQYRVQAQITF
jgi:phosphate-selective porin OprO/OprP